jgi:CRISPR-associated protein Cas2
MPLTIVVTRDVASRYRGFLASVMPEIAPGVYVSPTLSSAIRERIWAVVERWWTDAPGGSILLAYPSATADGGLAILTVGLPPVRMAVLDGVRVTCAGRRDESSENES